MLTIYTAPSCTSCKKAKDWFLRHQISYNERNMISSPLTETEVISILAMTEDGVYGVISTRNRFVKQLNIDFEELSFSEMVRIISENPQILRRPIIKDDRRLNIGYNEEEIRTFLPRAVRTIENRDARLRSVI
ncbi:transcriptional regulator Spx [Floricoccus penangensis]|uniref:Transcriptional regulator Spx n=1 Tax=Floricoccus penangensis TaxID=1859475 RepID=A0A9Q5JH34_9LACT|nr:transcriptional regulator Spx [Floricoccus penangensis]OFI47030.1 transcriptional regulator Spx [Floricoccus penangensis]URZ87686.1 transcriptional regulator Spx [Floricoccus penangensis]